MSLMTPEEVAEILKVPVGTLAVWRWRRKGPPWLKLERAVRYPEEQLLEWLHRN